MNISRCISLLLLLAIFVPLPAQADFGTKMLAFKCDGINKTVILEPFVQWNENYIFHGMKLEKPKIKKSQFLSGYSILSANSFWDSGIFKFECEFDKRKVRLFIDKYSLTIVDIEDKKSFSDEIDLFVTGSPWDGYGDVYQLKSTKFGEWQRCIAKGDVSDIQFDYKCSSLNELKK